jgi:hypothetical protein
VGGYTAAAERDAASDASPAADVRDSATGLQAMDVDAAPGASPAGPSGGAAPAGSPEDADLAPGDAHGLPPELLHPPRGECDPAVKVGIVCCIGWLNPTVFSSFWALCCVGRRPMLFMMSMRMHLYG